MERWLELDIIAIITGAMARCSGNSPTGDTRLGGSSPPVPWQPANGTLLTTHGVGAGSACRPRYTKALEGGTIMTRDLTEPERTPIAVPDVEW
jgi:hypothetical protein